MTDNSKQAQYKTLREYYAGKAMEGLLSQTIPGELAESVARRSVAYADALIKALKETHE